MSDNIAYIICSDSGNYHCIWTIDIKNNRYFNNKYLIPKKRGLQDWDRMNILNNYFNSFREAKSKLCQELGQKPKEIIDERAIRMWGKKIKIFQRK